MTLNPQELASSPQAMAEALAATSADVAAIKELLESAIKTPAEMHQSQPQVGESSGEQRNSIEAGSHAGLCADEACTPCVNATELIVRKTREAVGQELEAAAAWRGIIHVADQLGDAHQAYVKAGRPTEPEYVPDVLTLLAS